MRNETSMCQQNSNSFLLSLFFCSKIMNCRSNWVVHSVSQVQFLSKNWIWLVSPIWIFASKAKIWLFSWILESKISVFLDQKSRFKPKSCPNLNHEIIILADKSSTYFEFRAVRKSQFWHRNQNWPIYQLFKNS